MLPILTLRPREERRIKDGHLWVFATDLSALPSMEPGSLIRLSTSDGASLGTGFYNPQSKIAIRLLGGEIDVVDEEFFVERITRAARLRELLLPGVEAYRVVFGEADLLSGLIVDLYGSTLVIQTLSAGMDSRKHSIASALRRVFPSANGIIEKNLSQMRTKEGLDLVEGVIWGEVPTTVQFRENDILLEVDITAGQKTGYFLDQKLNRKVVADLSAGRTVLDCFCNVGGFALNAAKGGATESVGIDSSAPAIEAAQHHASINNLGVCTFVRANVFDYLREQVAEGRKWDMVILDPPSFAKHRGALRGALAGYAELNRTALKLLDSGGILVSASCTQLVPEHDLLDIIYRESARVRRRLRLIHRGSQAPDHPVLLAMPETQYLKFLVFEVM